MKRVKSEDRAGLYVTVIFHLVVVIVLLVVQIGFTLSRENSFVLDFTKQEQHEQEVRERDFKEDISRKIEDMLAASEAGYIPVRNVAVDRSALKDDRGTDAQKLYEDARRLQGDLDRGPGVQDDDVVDFTPKAQDKAPQEARQQQYSGPSVVSYDLGGRKASRLPIPAYRCMGAGMVTVIITVDNSGKVIGAKVQDGLSSDDACLRAFAVRAARMSMFSSDPSAPARQTGNIVYQFIAQ